MRRMIDPAICLGIFLSVTLALLSASATLGFTRDEGYYFQAAENHVAYYTEVLQGKARFTDRRHIERWFSYNNEHPPLMKTLFGLSWRLLHRCDCPKEGGLHPVAYPRRHVTLGLLSQGQAMRLPAHLLAGLLCAAVYLFGARAWGRSAGVVAAGLTILAPRHFFHAQLACFDAPITAMIFLVTAAYYFAQRTGRASFHIAAGVLAGLALSTKHNAFFLPFALLAHSIWVRRHLVREGGPRALLRVVFAPWIFYMAALAPPVYLISWPWLWHDTARRFAGYVAFHLHHVYYNIEYLGANYNKPPFPWHYVPVTTLLTAPVTTLALALCGAGLFLRDRRRARQADAAPGLLVAIGLLWPMLVIMRPGTPIFGSEKHWLPSYPFLALCAGYGLTRLWEGARPFIQGDGERRRAALGWALCGLMLVPPLLEVRRSHPYGLSHYNALAGGPQGAADLGMNRQFWGYAVRGLFPYLDRGAPPSCPIYWHDANLYMLQMSMKDGLLRRDLQDTGLEEPGVRAANIALVIHEKHFNKYEHWIWDAFGTTRPAQVLTHEGVPLVTLYRRPGSP